MDFFEIPDDYKPEKEMTAEEMQETTDYLVSHPLFMKEIPKDIENNPHLIALQNIIYDQDPEVLAESLNKQANERLKQNPDKLYFMKDAYKKYTEGIHCKSTNAETNAKLHCNRAAINYKIRNFGKVVEDCKMALKYKPDYAKAYYRYASALRQVKKYKECIELLKDRTEPELVTIREAAEKELAIQEQQLQEKQEAATNYKASVQQYCAKKGYHLVKRPEVIPGGYKLRFVEDRLCIPILLMYPEFSQFDVIESSYEEDKVFKHVAEVTKTGLPWDTLKEYNPESIEVYSTIQEAVVLKVTSKATVSSVLKKSLLPEALELIVVSNKSKYYAQFLAEYKIIPM